MNRRINNENRVWKIKLSLTKVSSGETDEELTLFVYNKEIVKLF